MLWLLMYNKTMRRREAELVYGASGWMYRVGIEAILGLKLKGDKGFAIEPAIPFTWEEYSIEFTRGNCKYYIRVERQEEKYISLDGEKLSGNLIPWLKEGEHQVIVKI